MNKIKLDSAIFDFDGTLVDSETLYTKSLIFTITAVTSIIGLMVHGFVDTVFFRPQIHFVFWTMVAIISVETKPSKFSINN